MQSWGLYEIVVITYGEIIIKENVMYELDDMICCIIPKIIRSFLNDLDIISCEIQLEI